MRVTAFSGSKDIESIKKLGAVEVVNSRETKFINAKSMQYDCVITTVPHISKEGVERAMQGLTKPGGRFVQVGLPAFNEKLDFDHLGLVFFGRQFNGSVVCNKAEYLRLLKICDMHKILSVCEVYGWDELP
jgi:D-arabinose 1-dehydrogenase-like Zn-dependent alcohol dehydrogenase